MLASVQGPTGLATALASGWVAQDELDQLQAEVLAWGERPDAFFALPIYSAVGWVDA